MRCLYIVAQDPISPNHHGGVSALYYDQLLALSDLGHEIHLWHFASGEARAQFHACVQREPATWRTVQNRCRTVRLSEYRNEEPLLHRGLGRLRSWLYPALPAPRWSLRKEFQNLLQQTRPDVIWAQHFAPAALAASQTSVPVVYVHHDWLYRIKALRHHRPIDPQSQDLEENLVCQVRAVVTGSQVEADELMALRGQGVHLLPVSYDPVPLQCSPADVERPPALVHLGGMGATASRDGLLGFLETAWPAVKPLGLRLLVVGDLTEAPPRLRALLAEADCRGFVPDLLSVLRPFDLQLIPWAHATGQRTRLPVAFNHAQVVVAVRAAVACYPEVRDRVNCRLVDALEEMPAVVAELARDPAQRFRLGTAARQTFEQSFVRPVLLPRYARVLDAAAPQPVNYRMSGK